MPVVTENEGQGPSASGNQKYRLLPSEGKEGRLRHREANRFRRQGRFLARTVVKAVTTRDSMTTNKNQTATMFEVALKLLLPSAPLRPTASAAELNLAMNDLGLAGATGRRLP
jgi:hypothetical protein